MLRKNKFIRVLGVLLIVISPLSSGVFSADTVVHAQGEIPTLYAEISFDWVDGRHWPLGNYVTLTIDDPDTALAPDYTDTKVVGTDQLPTYVRFDVWEDEYDLEPGHIVMLTDGITTKTHTALNIGITNVNMASNYVEGFAPTPGSLNVLAHDPCWENVSVSTDITGYWKATLVCDLSSVAYIHAEMQGTEEVGVSTGFFWSPPPPPAMQVEINHDFINGYDWPAEHWITLIINDEEIDTQQAVEYPWGTEVSFNSWDTGFEYDIQPGNVVTLEDKATGQTITHTAINIGITDVDTTDNIVTGYAERDATLTIVAHMPCWEAIEVIANGDDYIVEGYAYWQADFTGLCDLSPVNTIGAEQYDPDGMNRTTFFWSPPPPPTTHNIGLWWDEATVSAHDEIVLRTGWAACTSGLVTVLQKATQIDITINGEPLFPDGDEMLYWHPTEPFELEGCQAAPKGNQASVSMWTYNLGSLDPGVYEVHVHWWLEHPVVDGGDWDGDGKLDKAEGTIIENTITIFVIDESSSISGTVFEADGVTPIPNVHVDACSTDDTFCNGTETNTLGEYSINGLPPDKEYRVFIWGQPGWTNEIYEETIWWHEATFVSAGATGVDFTLEPGGSISGVVTDGDGNPLANIGVDIMDGGYGACTDENGYYAIMGLPFGTYDIVAGRDFCGPHPYSEQVTTGVTIDANTPDLSGYDFELTLGGSISGTVTAVGGGLIADNIDVSACFEDESFCGWTSVQSDGTYVITGLPSGDYRVHAYQWPEGYWIGEVFDNTQDWDAFTPVSVTAGQETPDINFTLALGGSISGTVTAVGGGLIEENIDVSACFEDGSFCGWASVQSDGTYQIMGLLPGEYRVHAYQYPEGDWIDEIYYETRDWNAYTPVEVMAGQDHPDINFTLEIGGSISGTVYETNGVDTIEGIYVDACSFDWSSCSSAQTDTNGDYNIQGLSDDKTYRVFIWGKPDWASEIYYETVFFHEATPVSVGAIDIDFTLEPGGSISGFVHDTSGNPLANIEVSTADHTYIVCTDEYGQYFNAGLPYGTYDLVAGGDFCGPHPYNTQSVTSITIDANIPNVEGINFTLELGTLP